MNLLVPIQDRSLGTGDVFDGVNTKYELNHSSDCGVDKIYPLHLKVNSSVFTASYFFADRFCTDFMKNLANTDGVK